MKGDEIGKIPAGRAFVRSGIIPAVGEVFLNVLGDKADGLGEAGRSGVIVNTSTNGNSLVVQFSPDGHNFSSDFALTVNNRELRFNYDDGVVVAGINLRGTAGQSYSVAIFPGRTSEGFVPQPPNVVPEPGPRRKLGRGKVA